MKVHHIGYAVSNFDAAKVIFESLGYTIGISTRDEARNVIIAFARNGNDLIEVIAPLSEGSPIDSVLQKNGSMPYHIAYSVNNIVEAMNDMRKKGWVVVNKPNPAPALDDHDVCFLYNKQIGLIELVEE